MKRLVVIAGFVAILINSWSCTKHTVKNEPDRSALELQQDLESVHACLNTAETYPEDSDSLGAEYYYLHALEMLDSLSAIYGQDSSITKLQKKVTASFDSYLDYTAKLEQDSLSAEMVLQDLNDIYGEHGLDSLYSGTPADSIPIVLNTKVEKAIKYFTTGRGRKVFNIWLQRAGRYEQMVKQILHEEGAPEELFYLAMIESGLNPNARSYARAVGMWQFIYATGRAYGLTRDWWFDDRRDPVKATRAAARHLLDLYERFGDWHLAIAGYNFNPNKIEKRLIQYNVNEFWELPRLPRQTRNYVPTFLATVSIARNPEKYNFQISPDTPLQFDTVTVKECVDLNVVAECIGSSFQEIKQLNPALLRWCTPPDADKWVLNLPANARETFVAKYDEIPKENKVSWAHHRVKYGETLSTIAGKYRVNVSEIKRFNKIRGSLIRAGQDLVIPIPKDKDHYRKYLATKKTSAPRTSSPRPRPKPVTDVPGRKKHVYAVKQGDSLWDIALSHNVTVTQIRQWNGLGYSRIIKPGQKLNIWLPAGIAPPPSTNGDEEPGKETVIARTEIPGLNVSGTLTQANSRTAIHTVRSGDTLWDIAQAYEVSIQDIKRWNGKRNNVIHPGEELKIVRE
jgi:membrane-bound lytic murein transglycosylase D